MASQATPEELEGLENGWRELEIGEMIPHDAHVRMKYREKDASWTDKTKIAKCHCSAYDPTYHRIICVEAD